MKVDIKVFVEYKLKVSSIDYCLEVSDLNDLKAYIKDILDKYHSGENVIQVKLSASIEPLTLEGVVKMEHVLYLESQNA